MAGPAQRRTTCTKELTEVPVGEYTAISSSIYPHLFCVLCTPLSVAMSREGRRDRDDGGGKTKISLLVRNLPLDARLV